MTTREVYVLNPLFDNDLWEWRRCESQKELDKLLSKHRQIAVDVFAQELGIINQSEPFPMLIFWCRSSIHKWEPFMPDIPEKGLEAEEYQGFMEAYYPVQLARIWTSSIIPQGVSLAIMVCPKEKPDFQSLSTATLAEIEQLCETYDTGLMADFAPAT